TEGYLFTELKFKTGIFRQIDIENQIYIKVKDNWIKYDNDILEQGIYEWKITGKKDINENVDWIGTAFGRDLTEWAWWSSDWDKRKEFNVTHYSGTVLNLPIYVNVSNVTGMQPDFKDIRFVNGTCDGVQDLELEFDLVNYTENSIHFWVNVTLSDGDNPFCMYYENDDATTGSNPAATYGFNNVYHFETTNSTGSLIDATNNNNCTTTAMPSFVDGVISKAVDFEGTLSAKCYYNDLNVGKNITVMVIAQSDTLVPTKNTLFG
ncbi:unnamed protein product, partial [marine sediment metagenome]